MNKIIVIVIAIILLSSFIFVLPTGEGNEIESSFGFWKIDIRIDTNEGTKTLSTIDTFGASLMSVFAEGQEVTSINYIVSARATGQGYDSAELDMSNAYISAVVNNNEIYGEYGNSDISLQLDSDYIDVFTLDGTSLVSALDNELTSGSHTVNFKLYSGDYKFRGVPDGDWQTSTSFPVTTLSIEVSNEVTCYQCDGQGGVESEEFDTSCPSGWSSSPPDCECYTDTKYGSWSSWSNRGCSAHHDCKRHQRRERDILEATICPGFVGPPYYEKVDTQYDYRLVYDSGCCEPDEVTCYKCDGQGGLLTDTFEDSCPWDWSSSAPDCSCDVTYDYDPWSDWEFQFCLGNDKWAKRTRKVYTMTTCPGFVGPPERVYDSTEEEWTHIHDPFYCTYIASILTGTTFSVVSSGNVEPYRTSSTQYLGRK